MPTKRDHFPGYPRLKRVAYSNRYGRMELLEVNKTSDGFLIGQALLGEGDNQFSHSVFLGRADDFGNEGDRPCVKQE